MTAADLDTWLRTELAARYAELRASAAAGVAPAAARAPLQADAPSALRPLSHADLLADDLAHLRSTHAAVCADGATTQAAATYLAGWFAGGVAEVVGLALATADAGLLAAPDTVGWRITAQGWPAAVACTAPEVVVAAGHPWVGHDGVAVLANAAAVRTQAVCALVEYVRPILDGCRKLAKVSRVGLWDEVADYLAGVLADRLDVTARSDQLDNLDAALAVPGVPWKGRPRLGWAPAAFGRVHVLQKGGCCLSFTERTPPELDEALIAIDPLFYARFPLETLGKRYCAPCKFRDGADADARQVFALERRHARGMGVD